MPTAALKTTRQFEKDLRKARECGKQLDNLWAVVKLIQEHEPLPARYRSHKLTGQWKGFWECHIEPDWLLIWLDQVHTRHSAYHHRLWIIYNNFLKSDIPHISSVSQN